MSDPNRVIHRARFPTIRSLPGRHEQLLMTHRILQPVLQHDCSARADESEKSIGTNIRCGFTSERGLRVDNFVFIFPVFAWQFRPGG
jgi:hypothetical protein